MIHHTHTCTQNTHMHTYTHDRYFGMRVIIETALDTSKHYLFAQVRTKFVVVVVVCV